MEACKHEITHGQFLLGGGYLDRSHLLTGKPHLQGQLIRLWGVRGLLFGCAAEVEACGTICDASTSEGVKATALGKGSAFRGWHACMQA